MINLDTIQQIKDSVSIVEVIGDFVQLKKRGTNYVGLSPFSNERTPSFHVNPVKEIYKDFSSGAGGDAINFLNRLNGWQYVQSIQYLAKRYKIDIGENDFVYIPKIRLQKPALPPDLIHPYELLPTIENPKENPLFTYLAERFGDDIISDLFKLYNVGTIRDWVIFWLVDKDTFVRSGKYIKYQSNGHRHKDTPATWHHKKTKEYKPVYPDFNLVQCFFGEHLINENLRKHIAIVESEKTAIVASLFMPKYTWIACGSKNGLNEAKCAVLANRSVTLFPDLGAFQEWAEIGRKLHYSINDNLERIATDEERAKGLDLADYLLR